MPDSSSIPPSDPADRAVLEELLVQALELLEQGGADRGLVVAQVIREVGGSDPCACQSGAREASRTCVVAAGDLAPAFERSEIDLPDVLGPACLDAERGGEVRLYVDGRREGAGAAAFCPPIALHEPWRTLTAVTPPASWR